MSSFLQCSIELLNSYDFVKQKKCKRGLLKSKGSHPCLDCVFHPNLWSNLYPPPGPNRAASSSKGPNSSRCCPESVVPPCTTLEVLFWPEAAGGRGYQNQLHPGLRELFPTGSSPSASLTAAALPGLQSQTSAALLLSRARAPRLLLAESVKQILDFSRRRSEGLSISPCCSSTSCMTRACNIHHLPSLLPRCSRQLAPSALPAPAEFHHYSPTSGASHSVFANSSTTKHSPDGER